MVDKDTIREKRPRKASIGARDGAAAAPAKALKSRKDLSGAREPYRPIEIDRRRQIVEIAFNHIATRGFEGLRFQEVAKEAGINNATLYYYFPSKEALIKGVTDFLMERLKAPPEPPPSPPANAIEELRQTFERSCRRLTADPSYFVVITELALRARRDSAIDRIGQQRDDFWSRRITGMIERGISEGLFRPDIHIESTTIALMAQLKGIAHHAAMRKRRPGEIEAVVSTIAAQVEHWLICRQAPQGFEG
jgi:TetR/AcrR family transcriptional regulator, regulator of cefoperazone and chloramphenicol sensitivity